MLFHLIALFAPIVVGPYGAYEIPVSNMERPDARSMWFAEANQIAETNEGTRYLVSAMEAASDLTTDHRLYFFLHEIVSEGWSGSRPDIERILITHSGVMREAALASQCKSIELPPPPEDPREDQIPIVEWEYLPLLMVAEAQRRTAMDQPDGCAELALDAMRLSSKMPLEETTFFSRYSLLRGTNHGLSALEVAVTHPDISENTLREIISTIEGIEESRIGYGCTLRNMLMRNLEANRSAHPVDENFVPESLEFFEALIANADRLFWEREWVCREWASQFTEYSLWLGNDESESLVIYFANFFPLQEDMFRNKLPLIRAQCLLRLGEEEAAREVIDLFTGDPIRFNDERIWSLGPDQVDQNGEVEVDFESNRQPGIYVIPEGDIIVRR